VTDALRVEPSGKRVRTFLGGELVADTRRPLLVWEVPYYPAYYLPVADVRDDVLVPTGTADGKRQFTVKAGGKEAVDAAWQFVEPPVETLRNYLRIHWSAMDSWFEEDDEVFVHPRDPYKRVDVLRSSRHVRVEVDGVVLAESNRPTILFETSLPPRFYLPQVDVRMDLLEPTDAVTRCPYKGQARYWSARVGDRFEPDLAWSYPYPIPDVHLIQGLISFYNERVDLVVDGEDLGRPRTPFSDNPFA
jgi:uncharacterized protein (DUF427 family)